MHSVVLELAQAKVVVSVSWGFLYSLLPFFEPLILMIWLGLRAYATRNIPFK